MMTSLPPADSLTAAASSESNHSHHPSTRAVLLSALIVLTVVMRVVPHPWNFSPVGAVALFGGAMFRSRWAAFLVPLSAMLLSDLILGLHTLLPVVYACYAFNVLVGMWLRDRRQVLPIAGATLLGSVVFFVVTNLGVWFIGHPLTLAGLTTCFTLALPFFHNTLVGDAVFVTLLFGAWAIAEARIPALRPVPDAQPA